MGVRQTIETLHRYDTANASGGDRKGVGGLWVCRTGPKPWVKEVCELKGGGHGAQATVVCSANIQTTHTERCSLQKLIHAGSDPPKFGIAGEGEASARDVRACPIKLRGHGSDCYQCWPPPSPPCLVAIRPFMLVPKPFELDVGALACEKGM